MKYNTTCEKEKKVRDQSDLDLSNPIAHSGKDNNKLLNKNKEEDIKTITISRNGEATGMTIKREIWKIKTMCADHK